MTDAALWETRYDIGALKATNDLAIDLARLEQEGWGCLEPEDLYRLKTWGICTQSTPGLHMFRIRIPGGRIGSGELRGLRALSVEHADGGAHITTRQNLELHSVPSRKARVVFEGIQALGLTTRSACGHTVRNIMGCTKTGICADEAFDVRPTIAALHEFFLSRAADLNQRLPRRINVSVAGCGECMAHAQVNDLGYVAVRDGDAEGFQLWAAGSLGSQPMLSHLLFGWVPVEEVCAVANAVTEVYCTHGIRDKAAKGRLKHLVAERGLEWFRAEVMRILEETRPVLGTRIEGPTTVVGCDRRARGEHDGVFPQKQDGFTRVEARAQLGDLDQHQMTMLADLADMFGDGAVYLTPEQNAELHFVPTEHADTVREAMREVKLRPSGAGSIVDVQVCAGSEWCTWGVGDSRGLAREIESTLEGIAEDLPDAEPLRVHISGCSHGCARHQAADIGLSAVAVREGTREGFEVYGGGRLGADPVAAKRLGKIPLPQVNATVTAMLRDFLTERDGGEDLASFLARTGRRVGARAPATPATPATPTPAPAEDA